MKKLKITRPLFSLLLALCLMVSAPVFAEDKKALTEEEKMEMVANPDDFGSRALVGDDHMTPVKGDTLHDGTYSVKVETDSGMFRVTDCALTVKDGKMTAKMTMSGTGYRFLFMGRGLKAVEAPEKDYIPFQENKKGEHTFTVPVSALDKPITCTALSKRKNKWYDHQILFQADSLPDDAVKKELSPAVYFAIGAAVAIFFMILSKKKAGKK